MICQMCRERGKTWEGGPENDPGCAFESGSFSRQNWNCATANAIRDICEAEAHEGVTWTYCDDQSYATIRIYDLLDEDSVEYQSVDGPMPLALWVTWYKRRGRTEGMWMLSDDGQPRVPTEKECRRIIECYQPTGTRRE